jgi:hypothetical protein
MSISARASRLHQWGPQLDPLTGTLIDPETDAQTFALPGARDRKDDVGELRRRGQVEIGLNMEIERGESSGTTGRVGARQQQVGTEADQPAHPIWLCVDDRTIEFVRGDPTAGGDAEWPLAVAQRLLPLSCRT